MIVTGHEYAAASGCTTSRHRGPPGQAWMWRPGATSTCGWRKLPACWRCCGADGLQAFCLYLEHLEQAPGSTVSDPGSDFSARWALTPSRESAERPARARAKTLRPAATRPWSDPGCCMGWRILPPRGGGPGGAPGGRCNPRLVVIRGGREDSRAASGRWGRPRKREMYPDSRKSGNRDPEPRPPDLPIRSTRAPPRFPVGPNRETETGRVGVGPGQTRIASF